MKVPHFDACWCIRVFTGLAWLCVSNTALSDFIPGAGLRLQLEDSNIALSGVGGSASDVYGAGRWGDDPFVPFAQLRVRDLPGAEPQLNDESVSANLSTLELKTAFDNRGQTDISARSQALLSDAFLWDPLLSPLEIIVRYRVAGRWTGGRTSVSGGFALTPLVGNSGSRIPAGTGFIDAFAFDTNDGVPVGPSASGGFFIDQEITRTLTLPAGNSGLFLDQSLHASVFDNGAFLDFGNTQGFGLSIPDRLAPFVARTSGFEFSNKLEPSDPRMQVPIPASFALMLLGLSVLFMSTNPRALGIRLDADSQLGSC